ncbi:MAG: hypothetical protein IT376_20410 [Polyangiaceae bacterium]|nr:hypothetical protein [Polyangiaceae bacterium]
MGIDEPRESLAEALSALGSEKRVPVRFVHLLPGTLPNPCPSTALYAGILRQITNFNRVFRSGGVQLWLRGVECFTSPTFAEASASIEVAWSTAYAELGGAGRPLPSMPADAWTPSSVVKSEVDWLMATATYHADPDTILVWIKQNGNSSVTDRPESGKGVLMYEQPIRNSNDPFKLAHELGHYFGLAHPWHLEQPTLGTGYLDPETGAQQTLADWWDLVYKAAATQGAPHQFFSSRTEAAPHTASLLEILPDEGGSASCSQQGSPPSSMSCQVGPDPGSKQTHDSADPELRGLAFVANGRYATNIMSYFLEAASEHFLSGSQVLLLRKYLRWDTSGVKSAYSKDRSPAHGLGPTGGRARLGSWASGNPLARVDFNGDGRRDLAVWTPPTAEGAAGRLRVLLSPGFTQLIDTPFGRVGDVPLVGQFDSDACSDFGVYQPGGGVARDAPNDTQAYWRWCSTQCAAPASTSCGSLPQTSCSTNCSAFGGRDHVPLPGLEMSGAAPDELGVFVPDWAGWFWLDGGVQGRLVGDPALGTGELLPGLYDADKKTDLVVYYRSNATYYYARSDQSWSPVGSRAMGAQFAPQPTGTSAERAGAVPVPFFRMMYVNIAPGVWIPDKRRTFSLFWPHDASWNTLWDPFGAGAVESCVFGDGRVDQPFTGFDRDGDFNADLGRFRDTAAGGTGAITTRNSVQGNCAGGALQTRLCSSCDIRTRVTPVADMTGDGREEIVLLHPDTMTIEWRTSESAYATTGGTWAVNDPLALFL